MRYHPRNKREVGKMLPLEFRKVTQCASRNRVGRIRDTTEIQRISSDAKRNSIRTSHDSIYISPYSIPLKANLCKFVSHSLLDWNAAGIKLKSSIRQRKQTLSRESRERISTSKVVLELSKKGWNKSCAYDRQLPMIYIGTNGNNDSKLENTSQLYYVAGLKKTRCKCSPLLTRYFNNIQ